MKTLFATILSAVFAVAPCLKAGQKDEPPGAGRGATQKSSDRQKERRPLPPEVEALVAEARIAPPEFAADALIRIEESNKVADAGWKVELLDEAFRLAASAQQPVRRYMVNDGHSVDSRAGYLSYGFETGLDTLSLRCRVVRAMLKLDKKHARELIAEIQPDLGLETLDCGDALVYDVAEFYDTLGEVAKEAFTAEELKRREQVRLVEPYVGGAQRVAQVGPAAKLIASLNVSRDDLLLLVLRFNGALKSVPADNRSFIPSLFFKEGIVRRIFDLAKECDAKGVGSDSLLEAFRTFLVSNLAGVRCADTEGVSSRIAGPRWLASINARLTKNPLTPEELKPRSVEGRTENYEYWQTPEAKRLLDGIKILRFGDKEEALTAEEKGTNEWRQELNDYLISLSAWDGNSEKSKEDYFHQKCVLYSGLLALDLPPELRDGVLANYVSFLRGWDLQNGSRIEWLMHVNFLLKWGREQKGDARKVLLAALGNSDVVTLRLYAALEEFNEAKASH